MTLIWKGFVGLQKKDPLWYNFFATKNKYRGDFFKLDNSNVSGKKQVNLYSNNIISKNILQDVKEGKKRPWREKKLRSLKVSESFKRLHCEKRAERIKYCGSTLEFIKPTDKQPQRKVYRANFCKDRMCPMCQWRKSQKVFYQVSTVMDRIEKEHSNLVPLFLTLTLKNCTADDFKETLDVYFQGWNRLMSRTKIQRVVKGWFRALEVTYKRENDTYHPHIHAIILVDRSYFKSKDYMHTTEWVKMWRKSLRIDYDPICDIRKVYNRKGTRKAVAEVAKYTLKDKEFVVDDNELLDKLIDVLSTGLRNRRLFAFGKLMKQIAKEIGLEEPGEGDLANIEGDEYREVTDRVIEVYTWNMGMTNYYKKFEYMEGSELVCDSG